MMLLILLGYTALYLLCRVLYTKPGEYTLYQWLWGDWKQLEYLFGWMLDWFWPIAIVSALPAVTGKYRVGFWMLFGCGAGLLLGEPLGDTPTYLHYGWWIWGLFVLISFVAGIRTERIYKKHGTCKNGSFLGVLIMAAIAYGCVIATALSSVRNIQASFNI